MALYKRPNSKYWWMKFTFDSELIQKSTNVANKRDAETVQSAFRTQLALGKIGIEPKKLAPTFDKAVEDFLKWCKTKYANQQSTYNRYFYACQSLLDHFGKVKVNKIEAKDVEKFITVRSGQMVKRTKKLVTRETINLEMIVLKMLFKRLIAAKILRDNPAFQIKQLQSNDRKFHVLTNEEERKYLLACPQPLKDVAILIIQSGMRCGEVYRIKRSEVFLESNLLKVTKGKTKSSIRNVHLSERARNVLQYRLNKFKGDCLFPQNDIDGTGPTKSLHNTHLRIIKKLKYSFRLYDCRHTFATRAVENDIDLITLSSILGHSNLAMVTRYAHPSENRKAEAIKLMEKTERSRKAKAV